MSIDWQIIGILKPVLQSELERTKSWNYSTINLEGLATLAKLGENVGVDLWSFQTDKSGGIRKAIEFLYPYLDNKNKWKYEQIDELKPGRLLPAIQMASRQYKDEKFKAISLSIPKVSSTDKDFLLN